jgi:hypothetical protein
MSSLAGRSTVDADGLQKRGSIGEKAMTGVIRIARMLLGLVFVVFGLNTFLHFIPAVLPSGLAGQFMSVLIQSRYLLFVGAFQVMGGSLLLVNRYAPLGLTLLGPIIVNILLYHLLLNREGGLIAVVVAIL